MNTRKLARPKQDRAGERFGRFLIVSPVRDPRRGGFSWLCRCDCGNERVVPYADLKRGRSTSCGCYCNEQRQAQRGRVNVTHGQSKASIYHTWRSMLARCGNPNNTSYSHYGGRGIAVCERWLSFENFYADMGDAPLGKSLDRIDPNGNYEPNNCRWSTQKEQQRNRVSHRLLTIRGETHPASVWAELRGLRQDTLNRRLARGWRPEDAVCLPLLPKGSRYA